MGPIGKGAANHRDDMTPIGPKARCEQVVPGCIQTSGFFPGWNIGRTGRASRPNHALVNHDTNKLLQACNKLAICIHFSSCLLFVQTGKYMLYDSILSESHPGLSFFCFTGCSKLGSTLISSLSWHAAKEQDISYSKPRMQKNQSRGLQVSLNTGSTERLSRSNTRVMSNCREWFNMINKYNMRPANLQQSYWVLWRADWRWRRSGPRCVWNLGETSAVAILTTFCTETTNGPVSSGLQLGSQHRWPDWSRAMWISQIGHLDWGSHDFWGSPWSLA